MDPVVNNYYAYGTSYDNRQYQIGTTLENLQTNNIVATTYADATQSYVL